MKLTSTSSKEDVPATEHSTKDSRLLFVELPCRHSKNGLLTWVRFDLKIIKNEVHFSDFVEQIVQNEHMDILHCGVLQKKTHKHRGAGVIL